MSSSIYDASDLKNPGQSMITHLNSSQLALKEYDPATEIRYNFGHILALLLGPILQLCFCEEL